MANERIIENLIRKKFELSNSDNMFIIEEQQSINPRINKLLQTASKKGKSKGYPDFIVSNCEDSKFVIIVECKANINKHKSTEQNRYADYAVDGVLLYSSYLSNDFDVIAIAISGNDVIHVIDSYIQLKGTKTPLPFNKGNMNLVDIRKSYVEDNIVRTHRYERLFEYTKQLNEKLHSYIISENERCYLLSGVLISLKNTAFKNSYKNHKTGFDLASNLVNSIISELKNVQIPKVKVESLEYAYQFIRTIPTLTKDKALFEQLIDDIDNNVNSFYKTYKFYDVFGDFYTEFLRYANKDKGLGIVLTPKHITELFCDLAQITKDSVVFDNCCGTGGFLITAMRKMINITDGNQRKEREIKVKQIVGIEYQDKIFPLLCANMILNGDGKTNLFHNNCFDIKPNQFKIEIKENEYEKVVPNIGFLNPPYKSKKSVKEEFEFVENNLNGLIDGGTCIALIPMSCVLADSGLQLTLKERILKKHTLRAVLSLPEQLFFNSEVGAVTCAIIITAHKPHPHNYETWFAYCRDDGFITRRIKGRIDGGTWQEKQQMWLSSYLNKTIIPGFSVCKKITATDEWCAEAYMETDYTYINYKMFQKVIKAIFIYKLKANTSVIKLFNDVLLSEQEPVSLNNKQHSFFSIEDLFKIVPTNGDTTNDLLPGDDIAYISAKKEDNGFQCLVARVGNEKYISDGNCIVFIQIGAGSAGYTTYQPSDFIGMKGKTCCGYSKYLNHYIGAYLVTVLDLERKRYSFGRSWTGDRLLKTKIKLPSTTDGKPDWQFMEDYIKSLPYSNNL